MKQYIFFILLIGFAYTTNAQSGYFGKKTVLEINGSLRATLIYNSLLSDYGYNSGTPNGKQSSRFIAGGFGASLSHYFSKRVGVGIDFSMGFNYLKTPNEFWLYSYDPNLGQDMSAIITVEELKMRTIYVIPKFEWASRGNLPIGIIHSIGIGYAGSSIVDKPYKQSATHVDYNGVQTVSASTLKGSSIAPVHGVVIEYGAKIRFPITSFMAFNLASHLRLHLPGIRYVTSGGHDTSTVEGQIERSMRNSRGSNLMDVRAGLSFILF